jgi:hypothetical protein
MLAILHSTPVPSETWALWDELIQDRREVGLRQSSWGMRLRRPGRDYTFGIMIRSNGILLGGAVVERVRWGNRHAFYRITDGPALPSDELRSVEAMRGILTAVQRRRHRDHLAISHLRIEPRWPLLPPAVEAVRPRLARIPGATPPSEILRLDLTASETALLARMGTSARAESALARQLGLAAVEDLTEQGVKDYLALRRPSGPTNGGRHLDEDQIIGLVEHFRAHRDGTLLFAEDGPTRLAGLIAVFLGGRAALIDSAAPHPSQRSVARTFLHYELMRRARMRHCTWYDVGPVSEDPRAPERALGGELIRPVPPFEVLLDPEGYEEFLRRKGVDLPLP